MHATYFHLSLYVLVCIKNKHDLLIPEPKDTTLATREGMTGQVGHVKEFNHQEENRKRPLRRTPTPGCQLNSWW